MSELLAHLAISIANKLKDPVLEILIRNHKPDSSNAYGIFPCPIDENAILHVFNKFCQKAVFPRPSSVTPAKEAHFSLNNFSANEIKAFVWYLDKKGIHSEFRPSSGMPSTLHLVIKDENNTHIKMTHTPVSVFKIRQDDLLEEERKIAATQRPSYTPPFNVIQTEKSFYILLDHMHYEDEELLAKSLKSRDIPFTQEHLEDHGYVYGIKFKHVVALSELKNTARTPENREKAPDTARLHPPTKGCPTINLLQDGEKICVPLDGMTLPQVESLKTRLVPIRLPYEQIEHKDFGTVLSFDAKYFRHLDALSVMLRAERKRNMASTGAEPSPG